VAIINDDLSAFSGVPTDFGVGHGRTVAYDIYGALLTAKQSDGSTNFFSSSNITTKGNKMLANLLTGTGGLSFTTLNAMRNQGIAQTEPTGFPAGLVFRNLLVPPAALGSADSLYTSEQLLPSLVTTSGANAVASPANNTLRGLFKPVCSSWLVNHPLSQAADATNVYLLTAATAIAYAIEVAFYNGQEMPIVERAEAEFDTLGIAFRGFGDYGVSLAEPRAAVKASA
jgi:hypothetical protein